MSIRSLGSEYVSRRSKALDACRPSDQAAIAIPPARPATRARNNSPATAAHQQPDLHPDHAHVRWATSRLVRPMQGRIY